MSISMMPARDGLSLAGSVIHRDPILVCGVPRSGTSWTAKVLSLAGTVRYLREPLSHGGYAADSGCEGVPYLTATDRDSAYEAVWRRVLSLHPLIARRWLMWHSGPVIKRAPFWPARLLIKEINCPLALEFVAAHFPMRIVITIRHPCGYVASGLRLHKVGHPVVELEHLTKQPRLMAEFPEEDRAWFGTLGDPVECLAAAYGIVHKVLAEQITRHPEWTLIHHESLCRGPMATFRRLCEAVDLPYSRRIDRYLTETTNCRDDELYGLKRVSSEQPDKWKTELTPAQVDSVSSVIGRFRLPFYRDFA